MLTANLAASIASTNTNPSSLIVAGRRGRRREGEEGERERKRREEEATRPPRTLERYSMDYHISPSDNKGMVLIVSCIVAPTITNEAKNKPTEPICVRIGSPILKNHLPSMDFLDPDNVSGC